MVIESTATLDSSDTSDEPKNKDEDVYVLESKVMSLYDR